MRTFEIVSPVDGNVYATCHYADRSRIMAAAEAGRKAFAEWRHVPFADRARMVRHFLTVLDRHRDRLAELVTWQMGRPAWQSDEMDRMLLSADVLIGDAEKILQPTLDQREENITRAVEQIPIGLCLSICAWNYPVAMSASLILAPLLMGNVVLFKHAPQTALIAEIFGEAAAESDLPDGVLQTLHMTHPDAEALIGSGLVDIVEFIGSSRGGHAIYDAGRGTFVRYGLELGGKDPVYLRPDVHLDRVIGDLLEGSYGNAGQSCCSVERIYVHKDIYGPFVDAFVSASAGVTMGHPVTEKPFFGPLVSAAARARVQVLVDDAVSKGAKALMPVGQSPLVQDGAAYMEAQVLSGVDHGMAIMKEETFGPVIPIMSVDSDEQAVALMNDSDYGLTASIWTQDIDRALSLGRRVESGTFYVNRCDYADLMLPFGGVKQSGIGRSYGHQGLQELVTTRSCHIRTLD